MTPLPSRERYPFSRLKKPSDSFAVSYRTVEERETLENRLNAAAYYHFGQGGYRIQKDSKSRGRIRIWRLTPTKVSE